MTFAAAFPRMFSAPFKPDLAADVVASWWVVPGKTCVAAYQPKDAASLAASYINRANPGAYDAAPGVAPTWDAATGWVFGGASHLEIGITVQTNYTILVRFSDAADSTVSYPLGGRTGEYDYGLLPSVSLAAHRFVSRTMIAQMEPAVTSGIMGTAGSSCYLNGAGEGQLSGMGPVLIRIGSFLTGFGFFTGKIQAVVVYSDTLTAGEVATVSAAMAAL